MELGQTRSPSDLIPGSPDEVRRTAGQWKARSTEAASVRRGLRTLDDHGTWAGDAYEAYLDRFDRQLLHWESADDHLLDGAKALYSWADALEWAQDEAANAIALWDEAEEQAAAALVAHREHLRSLRVGQGLRHPESDVPFVDPSAPLRSRAEEMLFNARATLEVFARDSAQRLDAASAAARMPLTEGEAAGAVNNALSRVVVDTVIVKPFKAMMNTLSVAAQTLWEHPDIILELLGGAATVVGGAALAVAGGGLTVTGAGAIAGAPALVVAGVGVAGAGAAMIGDAAGRWSAESHAVAERLRGVDRGDGRDYKGTFANGQGSKPWVDKEKIGLDQYAERNRVEVIRRKIKVDFDGSPQNGRYYDGYVKNGDGPNTYTGVEIKSGSAIDDYNRAGNTQRQFDDAVNSGTPARGKLDGEEIVITRVESRDVL